MTHPYRNRPPQEWPAPRPFGDWLGSWINSDSGWPGVIGFFGVLGLIITFINTGISCGRAAEANERRAVAERDTVLLREVSKMATGPCRDVRLLLEDRAGVVCPHPDHVMAAATDKAVRCVCRRK